MYLKDIILSVVFLKSRIKTSLVSLGKVLKYKLVKIRKSTENGNTLLLQNIIAAFLAAGFGIGVDRLSAPILSILPIIDIGHFKNRFADNFFFLIFFFFFFYANKHTIYR